MYAQSAMRVGGVGALVLDVMELTNTHNLQDMGFD